MTRSEKKILSILQSHKETITKNWVKEIEENPHFSSQALQKHSEVKVYTDSFLKDLLQTVKTEQLPKNPKRLFEPLIELWHDLLKRQTKIGLNTKDTALMIYALKTSIIKLYETHDVSTEELTQIEQLLDLLGMLTFEMYAVEKENQISRQKEHIHYLESHNLELDNIFIGKSAAMNIVYKSIGPILDNNLTVLLEGESGTGKDLIATTIHQNSKRKNNPFITLNCGAIPKELIESELFGHEKGAFTGADQQKLGKFELAHTGTLFLDEIGEMPLDSQVKLLRALQNKEIERVGGTKPTKIEVRIIAATNQNLKELVDTKKFRLDLYYRLNIYPIQLPPLRDRSEDIIDLANYFITKYAKQLNTKSSELSADAETYLQNHKWEGNIRELENVIQRVLILAQGQPITQALLTFYPGKPDNDTLLLPQQKQLPGGIEPLEATEKKAIIHAIKIKKGNLKQVAEALHISRTTLYNKISRYNLKTDLD